MLAPVRSRGEPPLHCVLLSAYLLLDQTSSPPQQNPYQLAFNTPGSSPAKARCRKQIRQSWNLRMKARGRPQILHRLCFCALYFGSLRDFCTLESLAKKDLHRVHCRGKGIPSSSKSLRASWSLLAVVTILTSMPRTLSILS